MDKIKRDNSEINKFINNKIINEYSSLKKRKTVKPQKNNSLTNSNTNNKTYKIISRRNFKFKTKKNLKQSTKKKIINVPRALRNGSQLIFIITSQNKKTSSGNSGGSLSPFSLQLLVG